TRSKRDWSSDVCSSDLIRHSLVEVAAVIGGHRWLAVGIDGLHQEKLDLGVDVAAKTVLSRLRQLAAQHLAWVRPRGLPIRHRDVAEHAGGEVAVLLPTEGQDLESRRVRLGDRVCLEGPREALNRGTIETDALRERPFQLGGSHGHGLQITLNVGEPEADEADIAFFKGAEDEFLLAAHSPPS